MRAHHLSASKMSLAHECAYGFRDDVTQHPRPSGVQAQVGTHVHSMAEKHVKKQEIVLSDDPNVLEAHAMLSAPLRRFLDATKWTAWEIGLRYDARTDTACLGPRRGEPGYEDHGAMVLPMTLDGVHVADGLVTVVDLKSGKLVDDTAQLRAQAVAASRYYGAKRARIGYVYARKTKCDEPKWIDLSEDDLDAEAGRIGRLLRTLPVAQPVPGDYCWRCDARAGCPAYGAEQAEASLRSLEDAGMFA